MENAEQKPESLEEGKIRSLWGRKEACSGPILLRSARLPGRDGALDPSLCFEPRNWRKGGEGWSWVGGTPVPCTFLGLLSGWGCPRLQSRL